MYDIKRMFQDFFNEKHRNVVPYFPHPGVSYISISDFLLQVPAFSSRGLSAEVRTD